MKLRSGDHKGKEIKLKIVIIGAGSQIFGSRSVMDILLEETFAEVETEIVLVDINSEKLEQMYRFASISAKQLNVKVKISATTNRDEALVGATYVFIAVSFNRYQLWEQDFRVPYSYGFKQAYAENGGPGALFHALRNIHVIMGICDDIAKYCPEAMVFNFSNPESRVLLAINELTSLDAIGLCHGQNDALQAVCSMLDRPQHSIEMRGGGINHFFWIQEILDAHTKEDLYPLVKEKAQDGKIRAREHYGWEAVSTEVLDVYKTELRNDYANKKFPRTKYLVEILKRNF